MATLAYDQTRPDTTSAAERPMTSRLAWVDALRAFLAILVVVHHAGQPYGGGGDWPVLADERSRSLGTFFAVNAAFFMGLFFLLAALFVPASFDRKGAVAFLRDRSVRLGVPLVVFGIGVFGFLAWTDTERTQSFPDYLVRHSIGNGQIELNHLWFLAHLLAYCSLYAAFRVVSDRVPALRRPVTWIPGHRAIAMFTIILAVATYLVRIAFPIDRWVVLGGFFRVEVAHVPQYATLFVIGLVAARGRWLERFPRQSGFVWLTIGIGAGAMRYAWDLWPTADLPRIVASGGAGWRSAVWSGWETLICVGLTIGLVTLARDVATAPPRWVRTTSSASLAIYIIHPFLLVPLHMALEAVALPPLARFAIASVLGVGWTIATVAGWNATTRKVSSHWRRAVAKTWPTGARNSARRGTI